MSLIDTAQINALSRFLDFAVQRQNVVSINLANIDTPNYRTKDIDFRRVLNDARTGMIESGAHPAVREAEGLMERPDGNNVSLERESLLLAQTQLQFRTGVQLLRSEFRRLQMAINEGR
jgi:flagellar basal-body rod protein FlgB